MGGLDVWIGQMAKVLRNRWALVISGRRCRQASKRGIGLAWKSSKKVSGARTWESREGSCGPCVLPEPWTSGSH